MPKAEIGLQKLELGPIALDGGMGTALTQLSATVVDTAVLTYDQPTTNDFNIEEQDDPFHSISIPGKKTLSWSTYDVEPTSLVKVAGGTASTDASGNAVWEPPVSAPEIELSGKLTTLKGSTIEIPRLKIVATPVFNFQKSALFQVDIVATILIPEKANTAPYKFTKKA